MIKELKIYEKSNIDTTLKKLIGLVFGANPYLEYDLKMEIVNEISEKMGGEREI